MRLPDLVIPLGALVSAGVDILPIEHITIYGPAALTGAIDVEVSPDDGTTWYSLAAAVAAGARVEVDRPQARFVRLVSTLAEAAERVFPLYGSDKNIA